MILAVNIGNTNIRAAINDKGVISQAVFYTQEDFTAGFFIKEVENGLGTGVFQKASGSIIASVVPKNAEIVAKALEEKTGKQAMRVNARECGALKTQKYSGLLGDDRIACCAMALQKYAPPFIVVDCGTATTVNVVNANGEFMGGAILTGLQTGLDALTANTAQLPIVEYKNTNISVIGENTAEGMLSGAVIGLACAIEGFAGRISEELSISPKVIITGGHAPVVLPFLRLEFIHEPSLLLDGLFFLYNKNNME